MGVVNVTPNSFSDGGQYLDTDKAISHAINLLDQGADILDIGGESTRPGAKPVDIEEEQKRILPVIRFLKKQNKNIIISVDTRNADTMQKSIDAGADIINDISALTHDENSLNIVAKSQCPVILMHMVGTPETMQSKATYNDVVQEIYNYLKMRIDVCLNAGIKFENIMCDPGIGFGKTLDNNLDIIKNIDKFHDLNCPILLGASRKSFIEKICPNTPADQRMAGSIATALYAFEMGVQIFRVHDVAETAQAFAVWQRISR